MIQRKQVRTRVGVCTYFSLIECLRYIPQKVYWTLSSRVWIISMFMIHEHSSMWPIFSGWPKFLKVFWMCVRRLYYIFLVPNRLANQKTELVRYICFLAFYQIPWLIASLPTIGFVVVQPISCHAFIRSFWFYKETTCPTIMQSVWCHVHVGTWNSPRGKADISGMADITSEEKVNIWKAA